MLQWEKGRARPKTKEYRRGAVMYYPPSYPYFPGQGQAGFFPQRSPYQEDLLRNRAAESKLLRRRCSWAGWASLGAILLLNLLFTFCSLLFTLSASQMADNQYYYISNLCYLTGFFLPALLLMWGLRMPFSAALPMGRVSLATAVPLVLFGAAVCNLANYPANLVTILLQGMGFSGDMPSSPLSQSPEVAVLFVISSAVIPPLVEEFLFRGVILGSLRRFGTGFAIVASSFLFAAMHGNFAQIVFAFPCGLVMAFLAVKSGSIWLPILVHALNNGLSAAYQLIELYQGTAAAVVYGTVFPIVLWVLGAASLLFLLLRSKGGLFRLPQPRPSLLTTGGKAGALFGNPGVIVFLCYVLISCVSYLIYY